MFDPEEDAVDPFNRLNVQTHQNQRLQVGHLDVLEGLDDPTGRDTDALQTLGLELFVG